MAAYKYGNYLRQDASQAFDDTHAPGESAPNPGIYRCTGCGDEISIARHHTLPPQNHHQHPNPLQPIRWQLIVFSESVTEGR